MVDSAQTVKVMAAHPSQGEWVVINAADFDPAKHRLYDGCQTVVKPALTPRRARQAKQLNTHEDHQNGDR